MPRIFRCDNCAVEISAADVLESPDPWPAVLTANPALVDPLFCTWSCLAEYAAVRALIESAGEG